VYKKETIAINAANQKKRADELVQDSKTPYEIEQEKLKAARQLYKIVDGNPVRVNEPEAKAMLGIKDKELQTLPPPQKREMTMPEMDYEEDFGNHMSQLQSQTNGHNTNAHQTPAKGSEMGDEIPQGLMSPNHEMVEDDNLKPIQPEQGQVAEEISKEQALSLLSPQEQAYATERALIITEESKTIPWIKFGMVWGVFFGTILCMLLQGAKGADSIAGLKKCGVADWMIFLAYCIFIVVVALWGSSMARKEEDRKVACNWKFDEFDKRWTAGRVLAANMSAPLVGLLAAAVGLGGGVSLNPTLMAFEFEPVTIAGTAMFLIMISKLASAMLYVLAGKMRIGYWMFLGVWLIAATIVANFQLKKIIKKFARQSLIAFVFVFFMGISVIMIVVVGIQKTTQNLDDGKDIWKFESYCDPAD